MEPAASTTAEPARSAPPAGAPELDVFDRGGPEPDAFDPDAGWDLHPRVAVRPERFGALLYHHDTRRLSFAKDPVLAMVLSGLGRARSARGACAAAGLDGQDPPASILAALDRLRRTGMIVRRMP